MVTCQVQNWNAQLWVQLQCPLRWPHCLFSLPNLYTLHLLYIPAMSGKTKGMVLFLKGLEQMWVLERSWVGYSCSQSLHGNHPQVGSFWYFKNPLSAGILQPAGGSLCRSPGSLTATWTLEGAKILGSQIKAKGSIWLGRKEKMFCAVAGKLLWVRGSGLPVPRVWVSLWESFWEWWQVCYHPVWWRFFHVASTWKWSCAK